MTALVIDASVAVKWFLAEDRSSDALALRERDDDLIAPASLLFEVFHALWTAARIGRCPWEELARAGPLIQKPFARLVPLEDLFADAAQLAQGFAHPVYDCVYLALGRREDATVVTADERMFQAARRARIKVHLL